MMKHDDNFSLEDGLDQDFDRVTLQIGSDDANSNIKSKYSNVDLKDTDTLLNGNVQINTETEKQFPCEDLSGNPKARPNTLAIIPWAGQSAKDFFSYRDGLVAKAIEECTKELTEPEEIVIGSWLLTEVSSWDNEKERLILLSSTSMYVIKYDFIALKLLDHRKVNVNDIDNIIVGELSYPPSSLIRSRNMSGIRVIWNKGAPLSFVEKWNPFEKEIPFVTFISHPLLWHKDGADIEKRMYNIDTLTADLKQVLDKKVLNFQCSVQHKPILIENYVGVASLIHNKNSLGFFKVRGKFSF